MRRFFSPHQLAHAPEKELHNGGFTDFAEKPARAEAMLMAIGGAEIPADQGEAPILAVHDAGYIAFLKTAPALWAEAGRPGDVTGYVWPVVGRRPLDLKRIDALIGRYSFDASSPLTADTWNAAYWSTQSVLAATHAVLGGERAAFALCRPPGHHSGADYLGGYCYLNSAAIAAQAARDAIAAFDPGLLILSFGADTWDGDPISHFTLTTEDYALLARDIAVRGWPTMIAMEGGYAIDALGANVTSLLSGFAE